MPSHQDVIFANVNANPGAGTDATIVAAVPNKKIRVLNYVLQASIAGIISVKSGAATTIATLEQTQLGRPNAPASDGFNGLFETAAGQALVVNPSTAAVVTGHVSYVLI